MVRVEIQRCIFSRTKYICVSLIIDVHRACFVAICKNIIAQLPSKLRWFVKCKSVSYNVIMGCCLSKKSRRPTEEEVDNHLNNSSTEADVHSLYAYDEENAAGHTEMQSLNVDELFSDEQFIPIYNKRFSGEPLIEKVTGAPFAAWLREFMSKVNIGDLNSLCFLLNGISLLSVNENCVDHSIQGTI